MAKWMLALLVHALIGLPVCSVGQAATWYVDGSVSVPGDGTSWETAFQKIQEALDSSSDGDTVTVRQGTYFENIQFKGKNIVLRSRDPLDPQVVSNTIIDGSRAGSVVMFAGTENESCVLSGFTIRNGYQGIVAGAAQILCNIVQANSGHGLYGCMGLTRNNLVSENEVFGLSHCGGTMEANIISGNYGGLYHCQGLIRGNIIADNAGVGGMSECEGTIENNVLYANSRTGSWESYRGGGALNQCVGLIQNNAIIGNSAPDGGGLYRCFGTIRGNTIVGNSAQYGGGGLYVCLGTIRNCVIYGNTSWYGQQVFASSEPTYSCIEDWQEGGGGNISDDPVFVDADGPDDDPETYEDNDYRLAPGSPCIGAGLNEPWMWEAVDLDGNPRIAYGRVDTGAYEHGSTAFMLLRLQPVLGGGTELTWASEPEASYAVWSRANLSAGRWTLELAIDSQGRLTRWTDPATSARAKFYRVELKQRGPPGL